MKTNLANCKRLYELSGWGDRAEVEHTWQQPSGVPTVIYTKAQGGEDNDGFLRPWAIPAYDSDYLLGKLPNNTMLEKLESTIYRASCFIPSEFEDSEPRVEATTSADALALLAIRLFENGILK